MKLFSTEQIRQLDRFTIENEPVSSIDLMERAAVVLTNEITKNYSTDTSMLIFAGPGNNGGDALAVARWLLNSGYKISVYLITENGKLSQDCLANKTRLEEVGNITELRSVAEVENLNPEVIIDGLFGSGLTRPLEGIYKNVVEWINHSNAEIISLDIPSGLPGEPTEITGYSIVKATKTLTLQFPKLSFLFPETGIYTGSWKVLDIGIHPQAINETATPYQLIEKKDVARLIPRRSGFSHKGTYGHALLVSGSKGMAGAAVLSGKAALRSGCGLVTVHSPECNREIVQSAVPEVIFDSDASYFSVSHLTETDKYNAVGIGPGLGVNPVTVSMLIKFLQNYHKPVVLDADALNCMADNKKLLEQLPINSILTPHPKEFDRLFGNCNQSFERLSKAQEAAQTLKIIIVLKGTYTAVILSDGSVHFNSTGNNGMATAGSGDVLTGIITSLLAQNYSPADAAITGVYLHGLAGNIALGKQSEESLMAGDIIENLGEAFKLIKQ